MSKIQKLRREVRLLHQRSQTVPFTCTEDGKPWPCPTVKVLRDVEMCEEPGCVLAADHPAGEHRERRVSQLACPHNVPNFGPDCPICD